jgi:hypothetical protein
MIDIPLTVLSVPFVVTWSIRRPFDCLDSAIEIPEPPLVVDTVSLELGTVLLCRRVLHKYEESCCEYQSASAQQISDCAKRHGIPP